jgi:hypothetical protein
MLRPLADLTTDTGTLAIFAAVRPLDLESPGAPLATVARQIHMFPDILSVIGNNTGTGICSLLSIAG